MNVAPGRDDTRVREIGEGALVPHASDDALGRLLDLPASLVEALRRCPRTAAGLESLLQHRLGALPDGTDETARRVLRLDGDGMRRLALCAGAVRHAREVLHLVDGATLRAFVAAVGEEPRAAALRWHDLADGAATAGEETLEAAVARDGWRCVHGWCMAQPPAVARRVLLSLPAGIEPADEDASPGTRIVDVLASHGDA